METAAVGAGDHTVWVNLFLDELEAGESALEVSEDLGQGVEIRQANHKAFYFYNSLKQKPCQKQLYRAVLQFFKWRLVPSCI